MKNVVLERLAWVLVYSGLLILCLGLFVRRGNEVFGWGLVAAGVLDALAGAFIIWLRSRRSDAN
jgi:uncharacterized membrane protein HdeD (DUF308 family)